VLHDGDGDRPHPVLVDYPFVDNPPAAEWIKTLPLCAEDREKPLNGNARRLLKL
jgi:predicted TIM-barrel fold metal-dependent hydrolase